MSSRICAPLPNRDPGTGPAQGRPNGLLRHCVRRPKAEKRVRDYFDAFKFGRLQRSEPSKRPLIARVLVLHRDRPAAGAA